jgi:hypothetical protein
LFIRISPDGGGPGMRRVLPSRVYHKLPEKPPSIPAPRFYPATWCEMVLPPYGDRFIPFSIATAIHLIIIERQTCEKMQ